MQVRDQVGAAAEAGRELHWHPEGGLLQVKEEPEKDLQAGHQEVVLHAYQGIWTTTTATTTKVQFWTLRYQNYYGLEICF